jgi:RND family efflux transporter MFP subunit
LGIALIGAGCHREEPKVVAAKPPEVFVAQPVERMVTESEEFTGHTVAVETVEIRARVSGYLEKVLFKDGDLVQAGDTLFEIDQRPYRAELNRAQAASAQSKAHLDRLDRQLERARKLHASNTISQDDFDTVSFDRTESEAALAAANANRELAELNLTFSRITAPVSGRISRRLVDAGNLIRADETPLATIVSINPIYAYFDVDERTLLRLQKLSEEGRIPSALNSQVPVDVALAGEEEFSLAGTMNFIDNQVEVSTGTLRARAVIDSPKRFLAPGLFVRLRLPIGAPRKAVLVQEEALGTDQGQRFVYVVNEQDEVNYRRVKVGWLTGGLRVIEEGLGPTDRVVVTGLQRVRPGVKVAPKPFEPPASVAAVTPPAAAAAPLHPSGGAR